MGSRDILEYDSGLLLVGLGQTRKYAGCQLLRFIEPSGFCIGRNSVRIKSILIEESRPNTILVWIGKAKGFFGSFPRCQSLSSVPNLSALLGMSCRYPCDSRGRFSLRDVFERLSQENSRPPIRSSSARYIASIRESACSDCRIVGFRCRSHGSVIKVSSCSG